MFEFNCVFEFNCENYPFSQQIAFPQVILYCLPNRCYNLRETYVCLDVTNILLILFGWKGCWKGSRTIHVFVCTYNYLYIPLQFLLEGALVSAGRLRWRQIWLTGGRYSTHQTLCSSGAAPPADADCCLCAAPAEIRSGDTSTPRSRTA